MVLCPQNQTQHLARVGQHSYRHRDDRLFASVFANPEQMKRIVNFLGTRRSGYTRQEILAKVGLDDNGASSKMLKALIASDFIQAYVPFGMSKHDEHYKLTDPFCLFYQKYVENHTEMDEAFLLIVGIFLLRFESKLEWESSSPLGRLGEASSYRFRQRMAIKEDVYCV